MTYTADRLKNLKGSTILDISHHAHRKGAVPLSAGAPDFDPPVTVTCGAGEAIHVFTTACAPTPLQYAMLAALGLPESYYCELIEFYTSRRNRVTKIPRDKGFSTLTPEGSFYTMADFTALGRGEDDVSFAYWLIDHAGVATVPGSCFYGSDPSLGRGSVRIAYPKKDETLDRLEERFAKSL